MSRVLSGLEKFGLGSLENIDIYQLFIYFYDLFFDAFSNIL